MAMANQSWMDAGFMLSDWEVRPRHGTLRRRDDASAEPVRVEPRVMAVLVCLAHHAGEVVTRDEFGADVWGGRIVTDEALSRCISVLRQLLGDDSREPRFIRTIARIGYTLVQVPAALPASVDLKGSCPAAADPASAPEPAAIAVSAPLPRIAVTTPGETPGAAVPEVWGVRLQHPTPAAIGAIALSIAGLLYYVSQSINPDAKAPPPPVSRLLVMPFDTAEATGFGRDVGVELADEISSSLARVEHLQISGRTSADMLAAEHLSAVAAGRKLGVDAVLNGSVAERSGGLRVAVQLTATSDARVIWSHVYERQAADIFAVESSIASTVVRELVGLLNQESVAESRASNRNPATSSRISSTCEACIRFVCAAKIRCASPWIYFPRRCAPRPVLRPRPGRPRVGLCAAAKLFVRGPRRDVCARRKGARECRRTFSHAYPECPEHALISDSCADNGPSRKPRFEPRSSRIPIIRTCARCIRSCWVRSAASMPR